MCSGKRRYNIKLWKTFTDCFNCLTGDHAVLSRSGWRSIRAMRRGDEVMSFNTDTHAMEWKPVTNVVSYSRDPRKAKDDLFRMEGAAMDVLATRDHRMLLARPSSNDRQSRLSVGYETVGELLGQSSKRSASRAVVRAGRNGQPAVKILIPGLENVCELWWAKDRQIGFLTFLGFWLGAGHLVPSTGSSHSCGYVSLSREQLHESAWLIGLLDELFPHCWSRDAIETIEHGTGHRYRIHCPPLYDYLRVMAVGPLGYQPDSASELRSYPHFTFNAQLAEKERQSPYHRLGAQAVWTEEGMLEAMRGTGALHCNTVVRDQADHRRSVVQSTSWDELSMSIDITRDAFLSSASQSPPSSFAASAAHSAGEAACHDVIASLREDESESAVEDDATAPKLAAVGAVMMEDEDAPAALDGSWFNLKRWLGIDNVATVFSRLSSQQAVALLDGFCQVDGECGRVEYDQETGRPTGQWQCGSASFPLIDHLQLIAQLAEAGVVLRLHAKDGETRPLDGRKVGTSVDRWALSLTFTQSATDGIQTAPFARPIDVSDDSTARGHHQYEDDGRAYCIEVSGNSNFLTQRLTRTRVVDANGCESIGVTAHPVYVGNCLPIAAIIDEKVRRATAHPLPSHSLSRPRTLLHLSLTLALTLPPLCCFWYRRSSVSTAVCLPSCTRWIRSAASCGRPTCRTRASSATSCGPTPTRRSTAGPRTTAACRSPSGATWWVSSSRSTTWTSCVARTRSWRTATSSSPSGDSSPSFRRQITAANSTTPER